MLHKAALALLQLGTDARLPRFFLTAATLKDAFGIDLPERAQVEPPHACFAFELLDQAQDGGVLGQWSTHRIVVDASAEPWVAAVERTMRADVQIDGKGMSYRVIFGIGFGPNRLDPIVNLTPESDQDVKIPKDDAVWLASFVRRFCHGLREGTIRLEPAAGQLSRPVRRRLGDLVGENSIATVVPPTECIASSHPPSRIIVPAEYVSSIWRDAALAPYLRGNQSARR